MIKKLRRFLNRLTESEMEELHRLLDVLNTWEGVRAEKNPIDAWRYQEIIYSKFPDVIIELGTFVGGSALYLNMLLERIGKGKIITVDINKHREFNKPRINFIQGDSVSWEVVDKIESMIKPSDKVMAILDSAHTKEQVLKELMIYSEFVSSGQYLIVEDTFYRKDSKMGPLEATEIFLKNNHEFSRDLEIDRVSFLSANHQGYLIKK